MTLKTRVLSFIISGAVALRDKASTVDFRDLCNGLLDMLPVQNADK